MNDLVLLGKAFADPTRIRILAALRRNELCVCELCDALEMSQSTLSTHLQTVRQAGLVTTRKDAKWTYYGIEAEQNALVETLFTFHQRALDTDRRLQRDAERVAHRLQLRVEGCCVLGFGQLQAAMKGGETP